MLAAALGTILVEPQLIAQPVTQTTTLTATATASSIQTLTSTATSLIQTTLTSTTTSVSTATSTSTTTETLTAFGTPSIGVITDANITLGKPDPSLGGVAADDLTNRIYVAGPSNVTVISGDNNSIVGAIPIHGGATSIAVDLGTGGVYANNASCALKCTQSLFVINGTSNQVIGSINLGQGVSGVAVNYVTNMVYALSDVGPVALFVINGTTNALVANVSVPSSPQGFPTAMRGVAVNQFTNMVYVAACVESIVCDPTTIYVINGTTNSIVAQVPIEGGMSLAMAVNSNTRTIYVTIGDALVSINGTTYAETSANVSALPLSCQGLAVGFDNDIYLSCSPEPNIPSFIIMDGSGRIINSFTQDGSPTRVAVYEGDGSAGVYVVNQNGYVLSVLWSRFGYP
jgi:DNA-binding beta-propeller fold protein YncE